MAQTCPNIFHGLNREATHEAWPPRPVRFVDVSSQPGQSRPAVDLEILARVPRATSVRSAEVQLKRGRLGHGGHDPNHHAMFWSKHLYQFLETFGPNTYFGSHATTSVILRFGSPMGGNHLLKAEDEAIRVAKMPLRHLNDPRHRPRRQKPVADRSVRHDGLHL